MGRQKTRIDYTAYSPNYVPHEGTWRDFRNLGSALRHARKLGAGTMLYRNFNHETKSGLITGDWWQADRCWKWTGSKWVRIADTRPITNYV